VTNRNVTNRNVDSGTCQENGVLVGLSAIRTIGRAFRDGISLLEIVARKLLRISQE